MSTTMEEAKMILEAMGLEKFGIYYCLFPEDDRKLCRSVSLHSEYTSSDPFGGLLAERIAKRKDIGCGWHERPHTYYPRFATRSPARKKAIEEAVGKLRAADEMYKKALEKLFKFLLDE